MPIKTFKLKAPFRPAGGQPMAIEKLEKILKSGVRHSALLGVTGAGKTFIMSKLIEKTQKPALIISPNKTLAAQLFQELKEFFPENAIHYFVSYYDYYQPEAYIPQSNTYIEKDAKINKKIEQLRHAAVQGLLQRKDIIIVASVSCIYGIGSPENYCRTSLNIKLNQKITRKEIISSLVSMQYQRNDVDSMPGVFRVRGETLDVFLPTGEKFLQIILPGERIKQISEIKFCPRNARTRQTALQTKPLREYSIYPAHFWATPKEKLNASLENIKSELQKRIKELKGQNKFLEAERLEQRTNYDMEMIKETGFCYGIENYSRYLEFRKPGQPPHTLIDYYLYPQPNQAAKEREFLVFIDESHIALPQLRAMSVQDKARKKILIEHGFRLPSSIDNRPLTFEEFNSKLKQTIYVSATLGREEKEKTSKKNIVEQLIRPTGLPEPLVEIRPAKNQIKNLIEEIKKETKKEKRDLSAETGRVLVLTITKKLSEAIASHLADKKIKVRWLHSEIKTLERPEILNDLREGKYDVLIGINLLREGLDLPEVSLVAILDADKEGFLRTKTMLIQAMGRAARHSEGRAILYADKITKSIKTAVNEIQRRRSIQLKYNKKHNLVPKTIKKKIKKNPSLSGQEEAPPIWSKVQDVYILKKKMEIAVKNLDFETAASIRDLIQKLKNDIK